MSNLEFNKILKLDDNEKNHKYSPYKGYYDLITEVIKSGIVQKDKEYLNGDRFKYHCQLINLNHHNMLELLKKQGYLK